MFSSNPNADPVLLRRYGGPEYSRLHGVPRASRWNFLPDDPLGGAALLLTNKAVASNVPFAAEMPASRCCILSCQRVILPQLAFTRALQLIAVIYPIVKQPIHSTSVS